MELDTAVSLLIALVALLISVYGIFERRAGIDRECRSQLVHLVDEIASLLRADDEASEDPDTESHDRAGLMAHLALLAEQATVLVSFLESGPRRARRHANSEEYSVLGVAYSRLGDLTASLANWRKAVAASAMSPRCTQVACRRGQAWCHLERHEHDEARRLLDEALSMMDRTDDRGRWDIVWTVAEWKFLLERQGWSIENDLLDRARAVAREAADPTAFTTLLEELSAESAEGWRGDLRPAGRLIVPG